MANQYSGSFEHKIRERFHCTVDELLNRYADEGLTYIEVEKKLGVSQSTVRKWAKRYSIELQNSQETLGSDDINVRSLFFAPELNIHNILSRKWLNVG